jgi:hypothetical protein
MTRLKQLLPLLLCALLAPAAWADAPRQITWKDLVPPIPADHPFAGMTRQQALQLSDIASLRERRARGEKLSPTESDDEQGAARKLRQAGLDVDSLLARRGEIAERNRQLAMAANPALDGQTVRIPGYLLPLEFSGKDVSEFLLVPWVGACIHTPPPPPNQIVHVKSDKPVGNVGLFAPIWVTGRLSATASRKSLYLVDGESNIDTAYSITASAVEPYKE